MQNGNLFLTIAEVAVAFAGFASIVSVLGERRSDVPNHVNAVRMRGMILSSLLAVAFSLLPFLLYSYGLDGANLWRTSSGILFLPTAAFAFSLVRRIRALRPRTGQRSNLRRWFFYLPLVTFAATLFACALNVLGGWSAKAVAIYLTSVALLLFISGLAFSLIVLPFLVPMSEDTGGQSSDRPE
jgi:hypothetical protein